MNTTTPAHAARDPFAASDAMRFGKPEAGWRRDLYRIIFESDTPAGKAFDVALLVVIVLSVAAVMADSVEGLAQRHRSALTTLEWVFTALFTIEYIARLACTDRPLRYATSFFGVVDLMAVLPTYIALFYPEAYVLVDVRILRLLRIFRIFKLTAFLTEYRLLGAAMKASSRKILVFLSVVVMIVLIVGTLMYVIEGPRHGFTSIPKAVYWAISTISTVGYGDLVPMTELGRTLASIMMLIGWGILAVPTGIVTAEMAAQRFGPREEHPKPCAACGETGHLADSVYCRTCGAQLPAPD